MSQAMARPLQEVKLVWVGDQVRVVGGPWRDELRTHVCEVRKLSRTNLAQAFCIAPSGFMFAAHVEDLELVHSNVGG